MKRYVAHYLYTLSAQGLIVNGFVELDDNGEITRIGKADSWTEEEYIEGIICPSFVNTHCHIELSYLWKTFRKATGMAGFIDQINELRDNKTKAEKLESIKFWMDKLWERGVSAMGDISNCDDSFEIKSKSPIYTRSFLEVFGTEARDCKGVMNSVSKLTQKAKSYGLDAAPTPHSCYTMSPELLTASSAAALKEGFLSFHSEETQEEEELIKYGRGKMYDNRKRAGMSTPPVTGKSSLLYFIDRLKEVHSAPFMEKILLVHECCMDKEGMEEVRTLMPNAYIALCPLSNLFIHESLPPIMLMRQEGMKLTIGTDSLSSNDDLDMVAEMYCIQNNFPQIPLSEILTWACKNGAEFLGKETILGTLEIGKKAGIVCIDNLSEDGLLTSASRSYRLV